ncbi:hypothetical protein FIBSPDRAFT_871907 [Athelia psychrophila]|uniref:Uncharacterized protein n=1 Tax=Athelia psychrophila TaxID=1759441 RepID=A0A166A125_9AGAM|nr:hypothetical protein FIBSPDRAFT_871907 [Fibularhizoctonia sp. CBS 109695]
MPPVALRSTSLVSLSNLHFYFYRSEDEFAGVMQMMCRFCVVVDPFLVGPTRGHIPCQNSLSSTHRFE